MNEVLTPDVRVGPCMQCGTPYEKSRRTGNKYLCSGCIRTDRWCTSGAHLVSIIRAARRQNLCKDHAKQASKESRDSRRSLLNDIKLSSGCVDCGYRDHPAALDFDHRPDETKLFDISRGTVRSWESVLLEIKKCDVRCANCHRIKTVERGESE